MLLLSLKSKYIIRYQHILHSILPVGFLLLQYIDCGCNVCPEIIEVIDSLVGRHLWTQTSICLMSCCLI